MKTVRAAEVRRKERDQVFEDLPDADRLEGCRVLEKQLRRLRKW
jgi:hypothetical protein